MRVAKGGEPSPPSLTARADQPAIAREPALTPEVWSVLTPRQSEVVASIRLRVATGRGLNLTAVKREDPRLVAEVFSMRPYWGWRRAIEAAGLPYDRIPISLEDTLECLVCGRRLRLLSGHLAAEHGLTRGEYQTEFPGAYCLAETLRALRMRCPATLPHWEPIWSAEYVLDRIRYLHDAGTNVNADSVDVIDPTLLDAGRKFWGTWDRALEEADLNPAKIRLAPPGHQFPSGEEVIGLICKRNESRLPLSSELVKSEDGRLMNSARKRFGSWRSALITAGIRPRDVYIGKWHAPGARKRFLTRCRRVAALPSGQGRTRALARLRQQYRSIADKSFGGWANVARLIGVPPERLLYRHAYRRDEILEALRSRRRAGFSMRVATVGKEDGPLAYAARREFGSLRGAYEFLGWQETEVE
jgi:hypothetical protein